MMLGCSMFWLITGGKLDCPIIKFFVLASHFRKITTFVNCKIPDWN